MLFWLCPQAQQRIYAVLGKLAGLNVVQVAGSYVGLRRLDRFEHMLEKVGWDVRRCGELIFDVGPPDNSTVQHVLHGRFPIPPWAAIGQQAGIANGIRDAHVLINIVMIAQHAIIKRANLVYRRKDGQRALVLVQCVAPAPDRIDLNGVVFGGVQLLDGLLRFGRIVERRLDSTLEHAGQRVFLEGGQTLQIGLVAVAVATQRHQTLVVVPAIA